MNIENIEAFVYVIHFNSFNKAAEALFLSQPSVTARIKSLERELDARLFEREGKQFTLTEKGKQFLPYAQQILQSYKKGIQYLQNKQTPHELRIGCTLAASSYMIPAILPILKRKRPDIRIKLVTASSELIVKQLLNKEVDLGFVRHVSHPLIDSVPFYEDQIGLFVHPKHSFAGREHVTVEEVSKQPLIYVECGSLDWMRFHRLFESLDRPPAMEYEIDNLETAKKLVLLGMGIGFLPWLSVNKEIRENLLVPVAFSPLESLFLRTNVVTLKGEGAALSELFLEIRKEADFTAIF